MNKYKQKLIFGVSILLLVSFNGISQNVDWRESLFLHINKRFFVSGEQLHFSAYVRSDLTKTLTDNSRILYVEILSANGVEAQQKVQLEKGLGEGSFFINSAIPSGNYQLIAYTRWMRNFDDVFKTPITIANPYKELESEKKNTNERTKEPAVVVKTTIAGDKVVNGIENTLILDLKNTNPSDSYTAMLVDGSGETITNITFNQQRRNEFTFEPNSQQQYKLILSSPTGRKYFSDLETVNEEKSVLRVEETSTEFKIAVVSNKKETDDYFKLRISNTQENIAEYRVRANRDVWIRPSELPSGFLLLELYEDDKLIDQSWIINNEMEILDKGNLSKEYSTRDSVSLFFDVPNGNYSVSIKKDYKHSYKESYHAVYNDAYANLDATNYEIKESSFFRRSSKFQFDKFDTTDLKLLPESRNEILKGKVTTDSDVNSVFLAFPGENYQIVTSDVGQDDYFKLHFISPNTNSAAYLGSLKGEEDLAFELVPQFIGTELDYTYEPLQFSENTLQEVKERSINVQIDKAYSDEAIDSLAIIETPWTKPLDEYEFEYYLEDYKKFGSIKEHITEYVTGVKVRRGEIIIAQNTTSREVSNTSLILLDGVPTTAKEVLAINPLKIKSIRSSRNLFFLYANVFSGVIEFTTFETDLSEVDMNTASKIEISPLNRMPDDSDLLKLDLHAPLRNDQLLWSPMNKVERQQLEVDFMTNDLEGKFKIEIEGFTVKGKPVSIVQYFNVTKSQQQ